MIVRLVCGVRFEFCERTVGEGGGGVNGEFRAPVRLRVPGVIGASVANTGRTLPHSPRPRRVQPTYSRASRGSSHRHPGIELRNQVTWRLA